MYRLAIGFISACTYAIKIFLSVLFEKVSKEEVPDGDPLYWIRLDATKNIRIMRTIARVPSTEIESESEEDENVETLAE
ncbi:hypothetical protein KIN20_026697 [Parelaphostrongylus tenuis]|uniref:Uncharacterized protein n=1 Tax=Parelaphostrongylus tenuis TaxID=148309 RepID=A0AAD5QYA5_PARTN|nr:hypothetical protein KIN20_026697 [Parelaphostrongylus tenuis]